MKFSENPLSIWIYCVKPGKWTVMYMCVSGIEFASFYNCSIEF